MITKNLITAMLLFGSVMTASAADYYVSPEGAGTKDGSSWENAWGVAELQEKLKKTGNSNTDATPNFNDKGDNIYFASGTYYLSAPLNIIKRGLSLVGATEGGRTIFSGDVNGNGIADSGDCDNIIYIKTDVAPGTTEKCINISNIDFTCLYINQAGSEYKGVIAMDNCGALVTVNNCNFTNLINTGQGANALFAKRSSVKFVDCKFTDNKAANRGVVARMQSDNAGKGFTTFDNCLFANNETTDANVPGGVVMMQHGKDMTFTNCVFKNNTIKGTGGVIYNLTEPATSGTLFARICNVNNCLIYDNTSSDDVMIGKNSATTITNTCVNTTEDPRISISGVGYGTYFLSCSYTMPEGVTGQTISAAADGALTYGETYNAGDEVPAGTALLVSGAQGQYEPVLAAVEASAPTNLLKGSDVAATTEGGDKYYKLANDSEKGLGFYWGAAEGAAFQNGAHKAYLALSYTQAAKARFFSLDGETTGINNIATGVARQGKYVENGTIVIVRNGIKYNVQGIKL